MNPFRLITLLICALWLHTAIAQTPPRTLTWQFPLPRPHTGVLLGNGTQGVMVWGGGRILHFTVSRTGFWDHRGGVEFNTKITYADLKTKLQAGDKAGIDAAFAAPKSEKPSLGHPQQLGGGRLDVTLPDGWLIQYGNLFTDRGLLQIVVRDPQQVSHVLNVRQAASLEVTELEIPKTCAENWLTNSFRITRLWPGRCGRRVSKSHSGW